MPTRRSSNHFPEKESESVLVQSQDGARNDDAQFRQTVGTVVTRLEGTKHVQNVQSPYARGNQGTLSEDGKSALVTFELAGDETADKVGPALATVSKLDRQEAGFRVEEFGDASADKALDQAFEDDFQKAEVTSLPITLIILILAFGALLAAFVPLLLAVTAVAAAVSPDRPDQPDRARGRGDQLRRAADRAGGGRRLRPVLHPPRARGARRRT